MDRITDQSGLADSDVVKANLEKGFSFLTIPKGPRGRYIYIRELKMGCNQDEASSLTFIRVFPPSHNVLFLILIV